MPDLLGAFEKFALTAYRCGEFFSGVVITAAVFHLRLYFKRK